MLDSPSPQSETPRLQIAQPALLISDRRQRPALAGLAAALDDAVYSGKERIDHTAPVILGDSVAREPLLAEISCPALSQGYGRYLLHSGQGYSVLAIICGPGQISSVHRHKTWCALGVHRGSLTEALFRRETEGLRLIASQQHHAGSVSHLPVESHAIHRIANLGIEAAVSIHVYGVPFDRLAEDVNHVWAD